MKMYAKSLEKKILSLDTKPLQLPQSANIEAELAMRKYTAKLKKENEIHRKRRKHAES